MALNNTQVSNLLFKKIAADKATTSIDKEYFEEPFNSRSFVLSSDIWTDDKSIPLTNPLLEANHNETHKVDNVDILQKKEKITLEIIPGTFSFKSDELYDIIPFNYGDGTYNYQLFLNNGTTPIPLGANNWFLDPVSGVLTFFDGLPSGVTESLPPKLTAYVYKGRKGEISGSTELIITKTFAELIDLVDNEELKPGHYYLLTDYQTIHEIINTDEVNEGQVEPLLLLAISEGSFNPKAMSMVWPKHEIIYDINDRLDGEDNDVNTKGRITYRKDELNNEADYDFMAYKFRRWNIVESDNNEIIGYTAHDPTIISIAGLNVSVDFMDFEDYTTFNPSKINTYNKLGKANNIVFFEDASSNNFKGDSASNGVTFIGNAAGNRFKECSGSIFTKNITGNTFNFGFSNNVVTGLLNNNIFNRKYIDKVIGDNISDSILGAGVIRNIKKVTTPTYTATDSDYLILVNSSNDTTPVNPKITLPSDPEEGREYRVSDKSGKAYLDNINIDGNGNTIEGSAEAVIDSDGGAFTILFDGDEWTITSFDI